MNQLEFVNLSARDKVFTVYKGRIVEMIIDSIYDNGNRKKSVILNVPNEGCQILRHMYTIYPNEIIKDNIK